MKKILIILTILLVSFSLYARGTIEQAEVSNALRVVLVVPNNLGDKAFSDLVWSGVH